MSDERHPAVYAPHAGGGRIRTVALHVGRPASASSASSGKVTTTIASGRTKSVVLEGRVTDAAADAFAAFQGFKGDIIHLGPDNKQLGGLAPQCGLRLTLPADGTHRLALNPFHDFAGTYRMSLVAVRPDRVTRRIQPGDVLTGTLQTRAEQDVFLVEMKPPVRSRSAARDAPSPSRPRSTSATPTYSQAAQSVASYANRGVVSCGARGKIVLPKAGTYRIVLSPFNNTTGAYRIPTQ